MNDQGRMTKMHPVSHTPRPSKLNRKFCAVCTQPIRLLTERVAYDKVYRRYEHVPDDARFNAGRQKRLYESLDVVVDHEHGDLVTPVLAEALHALHTWRGTPALWKLINRWLRDHGQEVIS